MGNSTIGEVFRKGKQHWWYTNNRKFTLIGDPLLRSIATYNISTTAQAMHPIGTSQDTLKRCKVSISVM
jgi:hypothetical protein